MSGGGQARRFVQAGQGLLATDQEVGEREQAAKLLIRLVRPFGCLVTQSP